MTFKILIVEDTNTIAALMQIYLMGWPMAFRVAKNGKEGLAMAMEDIPHLILSDVQMPVMDGFALCAALRADERLHTVPVVLLTSLSDAVSRNQGRMVGATAFLTKPVSNKALRSQVAALLKLDPERGTPL